MARVTTTDSEYEKASALADLIDTARQPSHQGLRLGDIIDALKAAKRDSRVEFDFGGLEPTGIQSYRGYYSDLALSYADEGLSAGDLLHVLELADGDVFEDHHNLARRSAIVYYWLHDPHQQIAR